VPDGAEGGGCSDDLGVQRPGVRDFEVDNCARACCVGRPESGVSTAPASSRSRRAGVQWRRPCPLRPCDSVPAVEQDYSGGTQPGSRLWSAALLSLEQNGTTAAVRRAAPCRRVQQIQADVGNGRRNRTEIGI